MIIHLRQSQLVSFVLVNSAGVEVPGLGTTFTVQISKNGGAFADSTGAKTEIGNGWYTYTLSTAETDTEGALAVKITGSGVQQQNLVYQISGSVLEAGAGGNILTSAEAAAILRCEEDDPNMLLLLPAIDAYIKRGSRDWTTEATIPQEAKNAARIALVQWHENPGMILSELETLSLGFRACMSQLRAMSLYYHIIEGSASAGYITLAVASEGDTVVSVTGKVGVSGDQASKFESVITETGYIQQTAAEDLSEKWYEVKLVPPGEM